MFEFHISTPNPCSQFLEIELSIPISYSTKISLQLPAWRAGRYQLANYAQNLRNLTIQNPQGETINSLKTSKDCWEFAASTPGTYKVKYEYYASKMDAGSCWVDDQQVYINFVNCCFEVKGALNLPYQVLFKDKNYPKIICTLEKSDSGYKAKDFQTLADSTLLAGKKLTYWKYQVHETDFHIWIHGEVAFSKNDFIKTFKKFTETQIRDFGDFPEKEYHFIFQLLPYKHYHGVEHRKGTVITYGPAEKLSEKEALADLVGVSSHELYHSWNVCRIRPIEINPYDFSKENYTDAGWILEGITTYMGNLYLLKSEYFTLEEYLVELEKIINRVSINFGWKNSSILESSFDLWLDGYQEGIPDRKQNIYANGCLIALALDISLLNHGSSLPEVMKMAWLKFGLPQKGYRQFSFWKLVERVSKNWDSKSFFSKYIAGNYSIIDLLKTMVSDLGLELIEKENDSDLTNLVGIIESEKTIKKIHPESPAYSKLMVGDQILENEISGSKINLAIKRINGQELKLSFPISKERFFPSYKLVVNQETELQKTWRA